MTIAGSTGRRADLDRGRPICSGSSQRVFPLTCAVGTGGCWRRRSRSDWQMHLLPRDPRTGAVRDVPPRPDRGGDRHPALRHRPLAQADAGARGFWDGSHQGRTPLHPRAPGLRPARHPDGADAMFHADRGPRPDRRGGAYRPINGGGPAADALRLLAHLPQGVAAVDGTGPRLRVPDQGHRIRGRFRQPARSRRIGRRAFHHNPLCRRRAHDRARTAVPATVLPGFARTAFLAQRPARTANLRDRPGQGRRRSTGHASGARDDTGHGGRTSRSRAA